MNTKDMHTGHYAALFIIIVLNEVGREATAKAIAGITLMHPDSATRAANELVELGLVRRDEIVASHGKGRRYSYFPLIGVTGFLPFLLGLRGRRREAE